MPEIQIVKVDQGGVNARILAKEAKADFRRVEAASLKLPTRFTSAEGKRFFVRVFNTLQLNAHFISVIARTRLDHEDIANEYTHNFVGMTTEPVSLDTLLQTRERLRWELPRRLTDRHRDFLTGLARAEPEWSLLQCPHAADLPALRWKLANLQTFRQRRLADFQKLADMLDAQLRNAGLV